MQDRYHINIKHHAQIIACWPSFYSLAKDLEVSMARIRDMYAADYVPIGFWSKLLEGAAARHMPWITLDLLCTTRKAGRK